MAHVLQIVVFHNSAKCQTKAFLNLFTNSLDNDFQKHNIYNVKKQKKN